MPNHVYNDRYTGVTLLGVGNDPLFGGAHFHGGDFSHSSLPNIQLTYTRLTSANFSNSNLSNASFRNVDANRTDFSNTDLRFADFCFASLAEANLQGADLRGADFYAANLLGAKLTGARRDIGDEAIAGWKRDPSTGLLRARRQNECHYCDVAVLRLCGNCADHCIHSQCPGCDDCAIGVSICDDCGLCGDCCDCLHCDRGCGRRRACNYDSDCGYCSHHCECGNEDDDEECEHGKPWFDPKPKDFKCSRTCGVEWEYNNQADLGKWRKKWRGGIHSDGSCGWEAVTAPMAGDHIEACLTDLAAEFDDKDVRADARCGIHVHVDARDMSWADMYRLLWVYGKIEPILYLLAGQKRSLGGNGGRSYCAPVGQKYLASLSEIDRKGGVLAVAFEKASPSIAKSYVRSHRMHKKDQGRYRGLNIIPWLAGRTTDPNTGKHRRAPDSTVEFRMHRNSLDAKRVIGWTQLCVRIVDWCANATDKQAQALPKSALRALCEVIAPDCAPWILSRVREWRNATKMKPSPYNPSVRKRTTPRYISLTKAGYALRASA